MCILINFCFKFIWVMELRVSLKKITEGGSCHDVFWDMSHFYFNLKILEMIFCGFGLYLEILSSEILQTYHFL